MTQCGKRVSALLLAVLLAAVLLVLPVGAAGLAEYPDLPKDTSVVDAAGMLSADMEQWIDEANGDLRRACEGATVAVLTVDNTGALTPQDYATEAFNLWGVGDKD